MLLAGAALPGLAAPVAHGQTPVPPVADDPSPVMPPVPPRPAGADTAPAAIDATKEYFVFFDQTIDVASMRALRKQLATLVEAGVTEITLVISSSGGLLSPMLQTYSFIRALPAKINTHGLNVVASAATVLYLAGETRTADRNAQFVFHPATFPLNGTVNEQQVHDWTSQIEAVHSSIVQIYHDRTTITPADIDRFDHGAVVYSAEQAQAVGVVQTVADLRIPGNGRAKVIFLE